MTDEFKSELRKAFADITLLVVGASVGGGLGYLIVGDHWVATWVLPVLGAWLVYHTVRSFRTAPSRDS